MDTRPFPQFAPPSTTDAAYYPPGAEQLSKQVRSVKRWLAQVKNPTRVMAYYFALVYTFIVFSQLHQLVGIAVGFDTHMLMIVGIPMIVLVLASDAIRRTLQWSAAKYWIGFTVWMILALPFSIWKSESLFVTLAWIRVEVLILFVIAGCVLTWKEVRRLMTVLAWAAAVDVIAGRLIATQVVGRFELSGTTMSDPNDYAAQLILMLPCLLLVIMTPSRMLIARIAAAGVLLYGVLLILLTGSRGGLIAVIASVLFCLWKLRPSQKIVAIALIILAVCATPYVVPRAILSRLTATFRSADQAQADPEVARALESSEARQYLLRQSILATASHPIFGVGAGQFSIYEGTEARAAGQHGAWHETHNSYTQVSSEIGIPALLFFLAAIVATYRLLSKVYRAAQRRPRSQEAQQVRTTAFCLMLALVGFSTAGFFLTYGYRFYFPALTGLAIALYRSVQQKWQAEALASSLPPIPPSPSA